MTPALPWILSALAGVLIGVGGYTFRYAEGLSYLSNDPNACANCHVMREFLDSWQKSSHHGRAVCNDCHTPRALPAKLWTKAQNGWNHSSKFTMQNFPDPIRITPSNAARLQDNCVRCHGGFVEEIHQPGLGRDERCVRCHAGVGHGPKR